MAELSLDQARAILGPPPVPDPQSDDAQASLAIQIHQAPETVQPLPRDRSSLDLVAHGVELTESGGNQLGKDGKILTSPKGNLGVMQLGVDTAKGLGVDPTNETQNREGGHRYLGQLFDKYGNWDQALAAYNWGPGNVDKWLEKGADPAKLPAETQNYVESVLRRSGLSDTASTAVVKGKRVLTLDEAREILGSPPGAKAPSTEDDNLLPPGFNGDMLPSLTAAEAPEFRDATSALVQGARKGAQNLVLGPIQAGLEIVNPQAAAQLTAKVNELEERFGSAEAQRKHPAMAMAGETLGVVGSIMSGAGLLGAAVKAPAFFGQAVPTVVRALMPSLGGAAIGATAYNPDPEHTSRVVEGALGAVGGELGRFLGKSAAWAGRALADKTAYSEALKTFQDSAAEVGRNVEGPLARFQSRVEGLRAENNRLYSRRTASGAGFEGFDSDSLRAAVRAPITETRLNGVAVAPATRAHANRVYDELGLREEDARAAASQSAMRRYEGEAEQWNKDYGSGIPPNVREAVLRRDIDSGRIPPPPAAPAPYTPLPVTPEKYSAALTAVNRGLRSVKGRDPAAFRQLSTMRAELMDAASAHAAELGVPVQTFLRRSEAANKFYQENLVPLNEFVRGVPGARTTQELTPAKFYDQMVKLVEKGDVKEIEKFAKMVGPAGQEDMRRTMLFRMLSEGQDASKAFDGRKAAGYIRDNFDALKTVFGRDGVEKMTGWAKIAERVASSPEKHRAWFAGTRSILPFIGVEEIVTGAMEGHTGRMLSGAALIAAPYASHALFTAMSKMERVPSIMPMVRAASKLSPGSPELERIVRVIEQRYRASGLAAGREGADQYSQP